MSSETAVAFQNVCKRFGNKDVLKDVSFSVEKGQALCVLGRSGVGKSVTLKLMIGLVKADSGGVLIDSEEISGFGEDDLCRVRRKMGFLFQSAALFDSHTVGDNLVLPLRRLAQDKSHEQIAHAVDEALEHVGLLQDKNKMPADLSGGMRKRAGLARAMVLEPEILLIDEPNSGLDPITASEIDDLLLDVKTNRHTTMVIVTHDIRGARKIADKVAVLDGASLVGFGTFDELGRSQNDTVRKLLSEA